MTNAPLKSGPVNTRRFAPVAIVFIGLAVTFLFTWSMFIHEDGKGWQHTISSDGIGYYAYLPSLIIYRDPGWEKFTAAERKLYGRPDYNPKYLTVSGGKQINKYFAGESILLLPFFLAALLFSWISGSEVNGLSFWFQFMTGIGALFYLLAGLRYLKKTLSCFGFGDTPIAAVLGAVVAGTNLLYYAIGQPSMSHTFSFFAINAFLWHIMKFNDQPSDLLRLKSGLILALVVLIRPVNILVLLAVPLFLRGSPISALIKKMIFKNPLFILAFAALLMVQPLLWHWQSGHWFIMSYPDEGFYFDRPRMADFLFSFRRGWFIYTPLMLLALRGILLMPGKKYVNLPWFLAFFIALVYVSSSWWCWYYGDGFGQRPMIDFYGIFAVLLAAVFDRLPGENRKAAAYLAVHLLIILNLFQTWQYAENYISRDNMNLKKYSYVFLRTADKFRDCLGGVEEVPFYQASLERPLAAFHNGFDKPQPYWINQLGCLDTAREFGPGIAVVYDSISKTPSMIFCEISLKIRDSVPAASNSAMMVVSVDSISRNYNYYIAFKLNDIPLESSREWRNLSYSLNLPVITNPRARLKIYLWNPGHGIFRVDDMEIKLYGKSEAGLTLRAV